MHYLESLVKQEIFSDNLLENKPQIAVAFSGGIDSMALLICLKNISKKFDIKIFPIYINHKLRKEADQEALWLQNYLKKYDMECHILVWEHEKLDSDIQSQARINRYKLLKDFCQQNNILTLLTAHHKNDIAENFFIRMQKNSGAIGLSSIKKVSYFFNIQIIRPFLTIEKYELENYLKEKDIKYITDYSNFNEDYTRVKIRNFLHNQHILTISNIFNVSTNLAITSDFLEETIYIFIANNVNIKKSGYAIVNYNQYINLNLELKLRILKFLLNTINPNNQTKTNRLQEILKKIRLGKKTTIAGCILILQTDGKLIISREYKEKNIFIPITKHKIIFDGRFKIDIKESYNLNELFIGTLSHQKFLSISKNKLKNKPKLWFTESIPFLKLNDIYYSPFIKDTDSNNFSDLIKVVFAPLTNF